MMMKNVSKSQEVLRKNNVSITGNVRSEKTLLFIHGFGNDQKAWHKIVPAFSKNYRILLIDNVGASPSNRADFVHNRYQKLDKYADSFGCL
jgi:sigma-B regulation protein RsbQ